MSDSASSLDKSVTQWIADWKAGDARASQQLWERFFQRVVGLARERLGGMIAEFTEEVAERLRVLDDPELLQIALWKLAGFENKEIAEKLGRVERSVELGSFTADDRWSYAA